jgi:hypothetical protein
MDRETISGPGMAEEQTVPEWWACYAGEFPRWYVWRGVTGHCYARIPRTSPPRVVRAQNAEGLRDAITRAESSPWPVASRSGVRDYCA